MTTAHVYQTYVAATPEQVWTAITDSDWTERYFHHTRFDGPLTAGSAYRTHIVPSGRPAIDGVVETLEPPQGGRPGRLVLTWHVLYDAALAAEQPGRVEWTVEAAGEGLTRVRLVHGDLAQSPRTWAQVKDGWVWVVESMKTLLETGSALPPVASEPPTVADVDGAWHRAQGVEANNATFDLLAEGRVQEAVRSAYAAAYHWDRAAGRTPVNAVRADYVVAKAELAADHPATALEAADRCLAGCLEHGLTDFDLAYAHEARARALGALGRFEEAASAWQEAIGVPIADEEDRRILEADLADPPVRA